MLLIVFLKYWKRCGMSNVILEIASTGLRRWTKPARDTEYLRWIKCFACMACGSTVMVDPAHTGPHGISQKASDYSCIPLCRKCHDEYDAAPRQFAGEREWDLAEIIAFWNHSWFLKTGKRIFETERRAA